MEKTSGNQESAQSERLKDSRAEGRTLTGDQAENRVPLCGVPPGGAQKSWDILGFLESVKDIFNRHGPVLDKARPTLGQKIQARGQQQQQH